MDANAIINTISVAVTVAQAAIDAGKDAAPFVKAIYDTFAGKTEVTESDLDALEAKIDALSDEFDVPLPE